MLYDSRSADSIPAMIQATDQGNYAALKQAVGAVAGVAQRLSAPILFSVLCGEEVPAWKPSPEPSAFNEKETYRNATELCQALPAPKGRPDFSLTGNIPMLVLSGEIDPATPPSSSVAFLKTVPNTYHAIVPGLGHGPSWTNCFSQLTGDFIASASLDNLDTSCATVRYAAR